MNTKSIASTAIAALMTFALAVPATALAGDRHHGKQGSSHNGGHRGGHRSGQYDGHRSRQHRKYKNKHHNKHQYNKRRHYSHGSHNNYYYRDDDDDEKLLIGLVVGGILGYAINNAQHQDDISYDRYPAPSNAYPANNGYNGSCLQEREYQTTVIVGGRKVDAYGTACLQPDGSWKRSPATVASY
jgi:Ni/Co efflux regulator RcnB